MIPQDEQLFVAVGAQSSSGDCPEHMVWGIGADGHTGGLHVIIIFDEEVLHGFLDCGGFPIEFFGVEGFGVRQHFFLFGEGHIFLDSAVFGEEEGSQPGGVLIVGVPACLTLDARAFLVFPVTGVGSVVYGVDNTRFGCGFFLFDFLFGHASLISMHFYILNQYILGKLKTLIFGFGVF